MTLLIQIGTEPHGEPPNQSLEIRRPSPPARFNRGEPQRGENLPERPTRRAARSSRLVPLPVRRLVGRGAGEATSRLPPLGAGGTRRRRHGERPAERGRRAAQISQVVGKR